MAKVHTGIWIDSREALIFVMKKEDEHFVRLSSGIDEYNVRGGSRSSTPFGPQDAVDEKQYLYKKQQQLQHFFNEVIDHIAESDEVLICGPGNTKLGLQSALLEANHRGYRLLGCHTLDSLTENQIRAWIRDRFGLPHSRSKRSHGLLSIAFL